MQGADKVTLKNVEYQQAQAFGHAWEIIAPYYLNPDFGNEFEIGYTTEAMIKVIPHPTFEDLNDRLQLLFPGTETEVAAFSFIGEDTCYIHIIQPEDWNDKSTMQSLGHEVLHCFKAHHIGDRNEETRNENSKGSYRIR